MDARDKANRLIVMKMTGVKFTPVTDAFAADDSNPNATGQLGAERSSEDPRTRSDPSLHPTGPVLRLVWCAPR